MTSIAIFSDKDYEYFEDKAFKRGYSIFKPNNMKDLHKFDIIVLDKDFEEFFEYSKSYPFMACFILVSEKISAPSKKPAAKSFVYSPKKIDLSEICNFLGVEAYVGDEIQEEMLIDLISLEH